MIVSAPDPAAVRARSVDELYRLRLPLPPSTFPLVWDAGDDVELRAVPEMEARTAILNVVLARAFGMPSRLAMTWLLDARLMERVTPPEWHYVASGQGDDHSFALHLEALTALAWLLGLTETARPGRARSADGLMSLAAEPARGRVVSGVAVAQSGRAARSGGRGRDARSLLLPRLGLPGGGASPGSRCPA